jgi:hypothetical protein
MLLTLFSILILGRAMQEKIEMFELSEVELQSFYDPVDYCILKTQNFTHCHLQEKTKSLLKTCPYCDHYCLATWPCHFTPSTLYKKPSANLTIEKVFGKKNLVNFLIYLNQTKKKLVFFGDSITRQSLQGLFCLILQQNHKIRITPPLYSLDKETQNYHFRITIPYPFLSDPSSLNIHPPLPLPPLAHDYQNRHPIHITLHFINFPHEITPPSQLQEILFDPITHLSSTSHGLILITNWGLHSPKLTYSKILSTLFEWAMSSSFLSHPLHDNFFFYRETSTQHFPNSPYGLYQGRNGEQTTCEAIDPKRNTQQEGDPLTGRNWMSVIEDELLKQYQGNGKGKKIERLSFRVISDSYSDLHHSSKENLKRFQFSEGYSDCTHYCGVPPLLWYALWTQLSEYHGFHY